MKNYLGIDIGTTSICMLLATEKGEVIKSCTVPNDSFIRCDEPWKKIQNPEIILSTVYDLLDEFSAYEISAIGVTGQMHGILYLDSNGNGVSELAIWQDGRGTLPYKNGTYASVLSEISGYPMASGYGLTTHFYNIINNIVPENGVCVCTIHDYVVMKLCGQKRPIMHTSDAASFGLFDIQKLKFDLNKIKIAGINPDILPDVTDNYDVVGEYKGIPVTVAIGDNQASFIGAGGNENNVLLNYGTGSQVSMITDAIKSTENTELRPLGCGKKIMVGCSLCGGRAYALLESFLRDVTEKMTGEAVGNLYSKMDELADANAQNSLNVSTLFDGTRKNPDIRGSIEGISTENFTVANLINGVLHGMSEELFGYYSEMLPFRSKKPEYIIASGNGIRKNKPLQGIIERQYGMTVRFPEYTEEAALGAAMTAGANAE